MWMSVFILGGLGSLLRWGVWGSGVTYPTVWVNIVGCVLIGLVFGLSQAKPEWMPQSLAIVVMAGFLGGLTTFSGFGLDLYRMMQGNQWLQMALYAVGSVLGGVLCVWLGVALVRVTLKGL